MANKPSRRVKRKPAADRVIRMYVLAIMAHLGYGLVGSNTRRVHVVVEASYSASGAAFVLCGQEIDQSYVATKGPTFYQKVCPQCKKLRDVLAGRVASGHNPDLFAIAGKVVVRVSEDELRLPLATPLALPKPVAYKRVELPAEFLPSGSGEFVVGRRGQLQTWQGEEPPRKVERAIRGKGGA